MSYKVDIEFDVENTGGSSFTGIKTDVNPIHLELKIRDRMLLKFQTEKNPKTLSKITFKINSEAVGFKHNSLSVFYSSFPGIETKTEILTLLAAIDFKKSNKFFTLTFIT